MKMESNPFISIAPSSHLSRCGSTWYAFMGQIEQFDIKTVGKQRIYTKFNC